ncbi:hypothetical protein D3C78_1238510 [compost metagenome]
MNNCRSAFTLSSLFQYDNLTFTFFTGSGAFDSFGAAVSFGVALSFVLLLFVLLELQPVMRIDKASKAVVGINHVLFIQRPPKFKICFAV